MSSRDKKRLEEMESEYRLVERIEEAARKGAIKGAKGPTGIKGIPISVLTTIITGVVTVVLVIGIFFLVKDMMENKWKDFMEDAKEQFSFADPAEEHDLVLDNRGILGYKAADFAEAILGDSSQLKKLEVYTQDIADVATITEAGLANIKIFEKNQLITYHGTAVYTVDLSLLAQDDIVMDADAKTITIYIPHSQMEEINIPEEKMEFGDVTSGWLAFGDIKLTPEQHQSIQAAARARMEQKLEETAAIDQADRFAKMSVWEIYQPAVSGVSPEFTLEIEFKDLAVAAN